MHTALIVLGMHRSGTSAVTRVLGLLGGGLPQDLMPPVPQSNELGFWESLSVCRLNDAILSRAGTKWDDWAPVTLDCGPSARAEILRGEAMATVRRNFPDQRLIVLKDPRICRIVPFWHSVLDGLGIRPLHLLMLRNPLEVAASLACRDGIDPERSCRIWLRHTLDAEYATRGTVRWVVSFDQLLSEWQNALSPTWRFLRDQHLLSSNVDAREVERFLQPGLRHHVMSDQALERTDSVSAWVKDAYFAMRGLVVGRESADLHDVLDAVRSAFDSQRHTPEPISNVVRVEPPRITE
jgi:hypothetical protein